MGDVFIKIYDKLSLILRIETTVNDITFLNTTKMSLKNYGDFLYFKLIFMLLF